MLEVSNQVRDDMSHVLIRHGSLQCLYLYKCGHFSRMHEGSFGRRYKFFFPLDKEGEEGEESRYGGQN